MLAQILLEATKKKRNAKKKVTVTVKHPGILEVPKGKNFWQLPFKHFTDIAKKYGYTPVIKALTNIEVWNRKKHPDIEEKAKKIRLKLTKLHEKEESKK